MDYSNSDRVPGMVCYEYVSALAFRPGAVATYCFQQGPLGHVGKAHGPVTAS
jgi:hypothetical protein